MMKIMTMMTMTVMMVTTMVLTIMLLLLLLMMMTKMLPPGVIATVIMAGTAQGILCFVSVLQRTGVITTLLHKHPCPTLGSEMFVLVLFDK